MQTHQDTKNQKSDSTTSLIPKDTKTNEISLSTSTQKTTGKTDSQTSPSTSNTAGASTTAVPTDSFVDFAQKAKNNGWGAPTPTMPKLGG
ncbi:hypothetical protein PQX77_016045 [Marasmius sp. AFHP31]|nr:hypothetical protein PQX77_016045 [Marasmius sp. AFHP31]